MQFLASSFFSTEPDSREVSDIAADSLLRDFSGEAPKAILVYSTVNHDQAVVLQELRQRFGPSPAIVGCSVQGVVGNRSLTEEGMVLGAMGFGGDGLSVAIGAEREIQTDSQEKGKRLALHLKSELGHDPGVVILLYDPLCGTDVEAWLRGMRLELNCPLLGGGSGQPWGPPVQTFQYLDQEVFSHGIVALALSGPFTPIIGVCHGTLSAGEYMTVTKAEGNRILEIDGHPAISIWRQITGCDEGDMVHQNHMAAWALGIEQTGQAQIAANGREAGQKIRGAFGFDFETGSVILQAAVPVGTKVKLQRRTVETVLQGSAKMGEDLKKKLAGRTPWAVLGFECAARTFPFLGPEKTMQEHQSLRSEIAPDSPWLGMMAWGEIGPCDGQPAFHNYTYPVLALVDAVLG